MLEDFRLFGEGKLYAHIRGAIPYGIITFVHR